MSGVVDAIVEIVETIVEVIVDVVVGIIDFVGDVIGFIMSPFGAFGGPDMGDPGQIAQGVTVTRNGSNVPLPVVYGHRKVGGTNIFTETNGVENSNLYVVYALCEGEIQGLHKVFVNDTELPRGGQQYPNGTTYVVTEGRYANRIALQFFNGSETQGQSALANESASWKTKKRTLPGIAYVVIRYYWAPIESQEEADNNPFGGGIPQVNFEVFGKKVYDVTTHGSGENLSGAYANRTKSYSVNPANCLLDFIENPRYGAGQAVDTINAETFKNAANKFNQTVQYSNNQSGRAMTMHAVIDTSQQVITNTQLLLQGCRSVFPFVNGRYKLKVEDGGHATDITSAVVNVAYDVDANEIIGGVKLVGERKSSKYNRVIVNYIDPDKAFSNQQVTFERSGHLAQDNNEILVGEFTFHTLTNVAIARDIAQMIYDKSRSQRTVTFNATHELLDVEVGDIITVTDEICGLSSDTFRVVGMKLKKDLTVEIEAVEHDATLYPFVRGAQVDIPPPLYLPDFYSIIPLVRKLPQFPVGIVHVYDDLIGDFSNLDPGTNDPPVPPSYGNIGDHSGLPPAAPPSDNGGIDDYYPPGGVPPTTGPPVTVPPGYDPVLPPVLTPVTAFQGHTTQRPIDGYYGRITQTEAAIARGEAPNGPYRFYNDYANGMYQVLANKGFAAIDLTNGFCPVYVNTKALHTLSGDKLTNVMKREPMGIGYYRPPGTGFLYQDSYSFTIQAPTDPTITHVRIIGYDNGQKVSDGVYNFGPVGQDSAAVGAFALTQTIVNFQISSPTIVFEAFFIRNYGNPIETTYAAGGNFTTLKTDGYLPTWFTGVNYVNEFFTRGYTYRDRHGRWVIDKGLNGYLNFLVYHRYNIALAADINVSTRHSLGGN
jgi:hypothetical protein